MRVIVPAAGRGQRLRPLTDGRPKPLVEVAGRPLVAHLLERLWAAGVTEVVCVTGYRADTLRDALCRCAPAPQLRFVHNAEYATTNSIVSLALTRPWWDADFCVVDADLALTGGLLDRMLSAPRDALAVDTGRAHQHIDMGVEVRGGRVRGLSKELPADRVTGEFFGVSRWTAQGARHLGAAIDELLAAGRDCAWYEEAIAAVAGRMPLGTIEAEETEWAEVDTPWDLPAAARLLAPTVA